jgi:hypothetical protein
MAPLRELVAAFAVTLKFTVPFPVPVLEVVSQAELLVAVQAHPLPAVTPKLPVPALAETEAEAGDTL